LLVSSNPAVLQHTHHCASVLCLFVLFDRGLLLIEAQVVLLLIRIDERARTHDRLVGRHQASLNVARDL